MKPPFSIAYYQVTALIGKGGMGDVYRANDTKLGREVAIKMLPAEVAENVERLARFQREARAVAALNHPNIVTLHSVEEWNGVHFLTMELIEGESLEKRIPADGFPIEQVLEIAESITQALAAAHVKGLAHRDLKPANVMIASDGRIKVLDFGLAKEIRKAEQTGNTATMLGRTQEGVAMGTPPYMSPEQILGGEVDHRTDIFSLGIILHEMVTGRRPFQGATSMEVAASILRDDPPSAATTKTGLPGELHELIQQCLAKDANLRIQTAQQAAGKLQQARRQFLSRGPQAKDAGSPLTRDAGFWVAVLPFKFTGASRELSALAEGLTEEIIAGLSRFSYLRVLTKGSAGARYVMEGSLRQAGAQLRVSVQLKETTTGASLWAENYTRPFSLDTIFEIQDNLVPTIVSTVGETNGILTHSMWTALRDRDPLSLSPDEAMLRCFGALEIQSPEELSLAAAALERAIQQEPKHSGCLAMLSVVHSHSFGMSFSKVPEPMEASLSSARRAVAAEPSNHLAHHALAMAHFFRKEVPAFKSAAERAQALNPMDGYTLASLGMRYAYLGEWDIGCGMVRQAMALNPRHPGWYWFTLTCNAYRQHDFQGALSFAVKINLPQVFHSAAALTAIHGQLGNQREAKQALKELLALKPDFGSVCRESFEKYFSDSEVVDLFVEGWRKAGLFDNAASAASTGSLRSAARTSFRVAVMLFKFRGEPALEGLAEGLTEEITAGFSRFSYLHVIGRGADISAARYVLEGSVRQAGSRLRVTVQLNDTARGAQLWAETYEREFNPDLIFEIQDDLVPRIVSTCADPYGVLPASLSEAVRGTNPADWSPYEALVRFFGYHQRLTAADHLEARQGLEHAVEIDPRNADCWAVLSLVYAHEYGHGFNPLPDPLSRAFAAAKRAVDLAPGNHLAHQALSTILLFRKEITACLHEADRAIALNPLDGGCNAAMGANFAFAGDWERGCALITKAMDLNPQHPVWYRGMLSFHEYWKANYTAAVDTAVRSNAPDLFWIQVLLAAAYGQLGQSEAASRVVRALKAQIPDFPAKARSILGTWLQSDFVAHLIEGLRKAGMQIDDEGSQTVAAAPPSIAVLPFANLSADKDQEYFSDGLAEEILNLLAQVSGLKVIARSSSFAFRGKQDDVRRIATALDVTHVVEGSVRRAGNRVRITAQLIVAADRSQLWSERYDRELSDVFAVQDEISSAITRALQVKLLPSAGLRSRYVPKLAAYEAYLQAKYHDAKVTPESIETSKRFYESAIALDPEFALAHVGLASYWVAQTVFGRCSAHEAIPAARLAIERALQIDGQLPEAQACLGCIAAFYDLDWEAAERHFASPLARQAGWALTRPIYGWFLFLRGDIAQAIELAERAIAEDPLEVWPRMNLHAYLQGAGRDREAYEQTLKVLELDPNLVVARVSMAHFHADWGQLPEAVAEARKAHAVGPWYPDARATLAALLLKSGEETEARTLYASLGTGQGFGDCRAQSLFYMLSGDVERAADWGEKAIAERDNSMMYYLRFVVARELRASARWPRIRRMVNLPETGLP